MDKIKTVKIKEEDGSVSQESYYISADARCVDMANGYDLQETIGTIDIDNEGNIAQQLKKKAYYFDTVADMKSANLQVGDYAVTLGYYSIDDGGAGKYKIINGAYNNNGGSYHKLNNNFFAKLIIENSIINVHQFGAYGDGTHDDSTFIQNAINYAIANNYKLFIDKNTYLINTGLIINGQINIDLIGILKTTKDIILLTITSSESIFNINNLIGNNNKGTGILLKNKNYNNSFNINTIKNFKYGISYIPENNGIQYSKTNFQLLDNMYNIYFKADNNSWVNQNEFFGGRCIGTYGVYLDEGTSQNNRYDGNNFYNIGFEEIYDAIILKHASLNTFRDFRMLENIENMCITTSNNCNGNLFESREASMSFWNKINDNTNVYQRRNIYKMGIQTSDFQKGAEELTILNNLPFIRKWRFNTTIDGNRKYLSSESTYNTADDPFNKIDLFTISLSGASTITINLDERYDYVEEDYKDFFVKINDRDGNKNLIIKTSNNTEIFNLSSYTGTTGSYSGIFYFKHITNTGNYKWIITKID